MQIRELMKTMADLVRRMDEAVRIKLTLRRSELRRQLVKQLVSRQQRQTEVDLTRSLAPLFAEQVESMAGRLRKLDGKSVEPFKFALMSYLCDKGWGSSDADEMEGFCDEEGLEKALKLAKVWEKEDGCPGRYMRDLEQWQKDTSQQAEALVRMVFDPAEWNDDLVVRTLPTLARKMAEAMVAQLLELGIDVRRKRAKSVKQTSATRWLDDYDGSAELLDEMLLESGQPLGVLTEIPTWMKKSISDQLKTTYAQPYWRDINLTTAGDAERVLDRGLREGLPIRKMADEMAGSFQGSTAKYARMRATRIARTESGNALGGARKAAGDKLKEEMGPQVPMKQSWLSVLGDTTRDDHAALDGVPEDDQGMWNLNGVSVPWPAHYSLPAGDRCNCFPAGVLVGGDFIGSQRAWYEGRFTEIIFCFGGRITFTPQHPIVTSKGLVPAGQIKPGDKVLAYNAKVDLPSMVAAGGDEVQNKPVPIEKLFESFATAMGIVEIRRTQVDDFHGDAESFQGNIEVVGADWSLLDDGKIGQFEKQGNSVFILEPEQLLVKAGFGSGFLSGYGIDGSPSSFPRFPEPVSGGRIGGITPAGSLAVGVAADFDSRLDQSSRQEGPGISGFLREALQRHSGSIAFEDVVEVRDFYSAGHVYDLQSRYGLVVAYNPLYTDIGIVSSNCQCTVTTEFGMEDAEARQLISEHEERLAE